jgi:hypothetical protein
MRAEGGAADLWLPSPPGFAHLRRRGVMIPKGGNERSAGCGEKRETGKRGKGEQPNRVPTRAHYESSTTLCNFRFNLNPSWSQFLWGRHGNLQHPVFAHRFHSLRV